MSCDVLLIDDGVIDNYIFKVLLKESDQNAEMVTCLNGKIALDTLQEAMFNGDLMPGYIFVDITMPTLDGWEFLAELCKLGIATFDKSKVYILTSSVFNSDYRKSLRYPFVNGFIQKPLSLKKLKNALNILEAH